MRKLALVVVLAMMSAGLVHARQEPQGRAVTVTPTPTPSSSIAGTALPKLVLTLALADMEQFKSGEFLPGAAKAIADLKDFLPYKSYRPLDTVFVIGFGTPNHPVKGQDGRPYELRIRPLATPAANLHLQLMDPNPPTPNALKWVIDTGVKLDPGETVVVGTSRIDGTRALLVLVTWVK